MAYPFGERPITPQAPIIVVEDPNTGIIHRGTESQIVDKLRRRSRSGRAHGRRVLDSAELGWSLSQALDDLRDSLPFFPLGGPEGLDG